MGKATGNHPITTDSHVRWQKKLNDPQSPHVGRGCEVEILDAWTCLVAEN